MKKISVFICVHLWTIFLVISASAQDFKTINNGIEYAETTREIDKLPVKINLLRLDLTKVRLDVVHAMDAAIGTETVSSMAKRHGALAAINAGFFRLDKSIFAGDAAGVLTIDGRLLSESYADRIALGISNNNKKTKVAFGHLKAYIFVSFSGNLTVFADGINRESKINESILYTSEFDQTPVTNDIATEIVLKDCRSVCWKSEFIESKGGTLIPEDGYVLSLQGEKRNLVTDAVRKKILSNSLKLATVVEMFQLLDSKKKTFNEMQDIIGGVPQLIKNGVIEITWEQEKYSKKDVEIKHPRTAVAKLKDGKFLMVTVDGRSAESSGIGLQHLAEILLELGAIDAMNLDGGGSTTMFLDGKIVNKPSDKEGERKVGDAILVTPRKK